MTLLSIIALGFFLGMRHAADPDHVVAVTTGASLYLARALSENRSSSGCHGASDRAALAAVVSLSR